MAASRTRRSTRWWPTVTQRRQPRRAARACRALDRVIAHGHYLVPAWTSSTVRVAYSDLEARRGRPPIAALSYPKACPTWIGP